jgi:DNA polymerase-4
LEAGREAARRILLVDCDQFYVQVARLEDPDGLAGIDLLIVGGSPTGRGVVTSASYGARAFGVRSAMPTARALRLCPDATVVGVRREACSRRSREVRDVLTRLSPVVQAASIDEFYLDLSGTERLFHGESLADTAWRIRDSVLDESGISVSIGGGVTRLVAKLATSLAKPGGVHVVPAGAEKDFMRQFRLADLPGVGPSLVEALARRGLVTVQDALPVEQSWLERWLGAKRGGWLYRRVRGLDRSRVDPHEPRRSVSSERTFARDLDSDARLERELMKLSVSVGRHLRRGDLAARTITVKLRDADFKTRTASVTLEDAVESDGVIFSVARELLQQLRRGRRAPTRLLGVGLSNLTSGGSSERQLALFEEEQPMESERQRTLAHAVDDLNRRFGDRAVLPGRIVRRDS